MCSTVEDGKGHLDQFFYSIFNDFKIAFDSESRIIASHKIAELCMLSLLLSFIRRAPKKTTIDNKITKRLYLADDRFYELR